VGILKTWLITGVSGFIGSHILQKLLKQDQRVVGLDNFATGNARNLDQVKQAVSETQWKQFSLIEGDVVNPEDCRKACAGVQYVLHQAAVASVPRSIKDPLGTHNINVTGFVNMLLAARDSGVLRFVYASSSAVYGDIPDVPNREPSIGRLLSPYAVSKRANELYADVFASTYNFPAVGLRYFNIFGPRQDPEGPYAAVIPRWIDAMLKNSPITIFGDGSTSRDFCYVEDVARANILAATASGLDGHDVFNIAAGQQTTLNQLFSMLQQSLSAQCPHLKDYRPQYEDFRPGDVKHSQADIRKAKQLLGFEPKFSVQQGLKKYLQGLRTT